MSLAYDILDTHLVMKNICGGCNLFPMLQSLEVKEEGGRKKMN